MRAPTISTRRSTRRPPPVRGHLTPILDRIAKSGDFAIAVAMLDHVIPDLTRGDVQQ